MSDQAQTDNQQVIVYALVAIAVLLAAIVGFMIYNNTQKAGASAGSSTAASDTTGAGIAAQMPTPAAPVTFDPKTATKLPSGLTPETALKAYSDAVVAGKWDAAFALLPLAGKKTYATSDAMGSQLKSYGITGFRQGKATSNGANTTIVLEEDTPAMNITYTWVFTKVGNDWFANTRTMGGTIQ
jgi:hypothetical protein